MSRLGLRVAASSSRAARVAFVCTQPCRIQSRGLHQRKPLSYPIEKGLGDFLSPNALKVIAEDYQQGLLDRLNDQVRGTALQDKSIVQTIIDAAQDPDKVLEFNYASEALNNSFFLETLKPPPPNVNSHESVLGEDRSQTSLLRRIGVYYGSLPQLQSNFSAAVLGMFSSGWVWLVTDQRGRLGIIPTFGAGTLLARSSKPTASYTQWEHLSGGQPTHWYSDPLPYDPSLPSAPPPPPPHPATTDAMGNGHSGSKPPLASSPVSGASHTLPTLDPHTPARSITYARPRMDEDTYEGILHDLTKEEERKIGQVLHPLLCVSVHEHAWMSAGYGVWGKEEYMKRFWTVVDWSKVKSMYSKAHTSD